MYVVPGWELAYLILGIYKHGGYSAQFNDESVFFKILHFMNIVVIFWNLKTNVTGTCLSRQLFIFSHIFQP